MFEFHYIQTGRDREKERETDRQKERETERKRERKREREKERQKEREKERKKERMKERKTERMNGRIFSSDLGEQIQSRVDLLSGLRLTEDIPKPQRLITSPCHYRFPVRRTR